jgi:hypothetical protein
MGGFKSPRSVIALAAVFIIMPPSVHETSLAGTPSMTKILTHTATIRLPITPLVAAWSPDSALLAVNQIGTGLIRIIDVKQRKLLDIFATPQAGLPSLAWSADKNTLAMVSPAKIWFINYPSMKRIGETLRDSDHCSFNNHGSAVFTNDNLSLWVGCQASSRKSVEIAAVKVDLKTLQVVDSVPLAAPADGYVGAWSAQIFTDTPGSISILASSSFWTKVGDSGENVLENYFSAFDADTKGTLVKNFKVKTFEPGSAENRIGYVDRFLYSVTAKTIAVTTHDHKESKVTIVDPDQVGNFKVVSQQTDPFIIGISRLTFSKKGKYLIGGVSSGNVGEKFSKLVVWNVETGKLVQTEPFGNVHTFFLSADGLQLAVLSDRRVEFFSIRE